jgi:hypothetical protein
MPVLLYQEATPSRYLSLFPLQLFGTDEMLHKTAASVLGWALIVAATANEVIGRRVRAWVSWSGWQTPLHALPLLAPQQPRFILPCVTFNTYHSFFPLVKA